MCVLELRPSGVAISMLNHPTGPGLMSSVFPSAASEPSSRGLGGFTEMLTPRPLQTGPAHHHVAGVRPRPFAGWGVTRNVVPAACRRWLRHTHAGAAPGSATYGSGAWPGARAPRTPAPPPEWPARRPAALGSPPLRQLGGHSVLRSSPPFHVSRKR